ncbi:MAG TPA: glycosyl hydrolase 53 family protein [Glycomyces sp.]|nr:glycosyl hydrolase 53 family protein [Glycomyces sp.]
MKRRTAITAAGALGAAAVAAAPALADDSAPRAAAQSTFLRGADISSLAKSEDYGGTYMWPDGRRDDAVRILAGSGVDCVRLKVWVAPADGYNTKDQVVAIGKRARDAGMDLLVDFHYSDTWADPGKQYKPAAWEGLDLAGLEEAVYAHTADVLGSLDEAGAPAGHVQVGNEINGGMLWPDGGYDRWPQLARLLTAGAEAVRDTAPGAEVILHLAEGGDNGAFRWFFDNAGSHGVPYDAIGASYYPYWHGPLTALQSNLDDLTRRYGKPLYVLETAYPFGTEDADGTANLMGDAEPVAGYPSSPQGQSDMLRAVAAVVKAVPDGLGRGVFWWEATWTAVEGNGWDPADPSSGNAWENQALFDYGWRAARALEALGKL